MRTLEDVKAHLAKLIAEAMYMDAGELEDDQLFSSFGLESSTLVKILHNVNSHYGAAIEMRELLPHQTLQEASDFVYSKVASQPVLN
jgi:acyl carrier protein